ncbi:MAG: hypothetical protein OIN83_06945 [Candidatus Methanoperedens sp.]|nr:hypothetical protein [Candidatus Methanoperedens sp.]
MTIKKRSIFRKKSMVSAMLIENRSISTLGSAGLQARLRNLNRGPMKWDAPGF